MWAVVTTGNGGYDKLDYRRVPAPLPTAGEALVQVLAAGINNTEINTRLGWYSSSVTSSTGDLSVSREAAAEHKADGGWNEARRSRSFREPIAVVVSSHLARVKTPATIFWGGVS